MAQSPDSQGSPDSLEGYLDNWDALSSMLTRGRSFSGRERHCSFLNLGPGQPFADISASSGLDLIDDGRAVLATDWDRDGDLDLWFTNREGPRLRFLKNQLPAAQRSQWIAFELSGTSPTCNPDAIGAVLVLKQNNQTLARTLTAGDGFMSQSSKRIHFGLGPISNNKPLEVTVRWPGGSAETFAGLTPGKIHHLKQGSGVAQPIKTEAAPALAPVEVEVPVHTEQARLLLSHRLPTPVLKYVDFQGNLQNFKPDKLENPILLSLWSSSCPLCQAELAAFKEHHSQFVSKGLDILALTVDAIPKGSELPDISGAKSLVATSNFPFKVGAIDANGARLLTVLNNQIIVRQRPLPLPVSFLIDREGRIAALYKGTVEPGQLLADLELIDTKGPELAKHAFPFPSRDGTELFSLGALDFARAYLNGGDHEAARREARKLIDAPSTDLAWKVQAWYFLATLEQSQRQWKAAAEAYQTVLKLNPQQVMLNIPLAVSLWQDGQKEAAEAAFSTVLKTGEKDLSVLNALGKAHLQIKEYQKAASYFQKALALDPKNPSLRSSLALTWQISGDSNKAIAAYRELLAENPDSVNAKNNLVLLLATAPDDQLRNGAEALKLAREVLAQAGETHHSPLDALGTALAETGDFQGAIEATGKALNLARAIGRNDLLPKLQAKIELYQSGQPFRSAP